MDNEILKALDRIKAYALLGAKQVITMDEAAMLTGLGKDHLYKLTSSRRIPFYKPNGKNIYFKKDELEGWLLQGRVAAQDELESAAARESVMSGR